MARLEFDFHARPARPGKLGIVLALAGVAALGWSMSNLLAARATEAGLALQIAALEQSRPRAAVKSATPTDQVAKTTQTRIAAQLAYSWQPAFDALANARSSKVALVSLDAVQAKSQIKLVAEARQLADAVAFIEVLQQQPGIRRAALTQHEEQADDAQKPVRFNILVELEP
ncbi:MAG: PilN domain-containing protein [Gammaproteobacteria bacterium]|nr:PilN domain-containing protein [Gammaproteobacteria bacterium]